MQSYLDAIRPDQSVEVVIGRRSVREIGRAHV